MDNMYKNTKQGRLLLERTQAISPKVWSIVVCSRCSTRFDMRFVSWSEGSPRCPKCRKIQ